MFFDKITCPFCFTRFSPRNVAFRCTNRTCTSYTEPDRPLQTFYGKVPDDKIKGHIVNPTGIRLFTPEQCKCDVCGISTVNTVCPCCHNSLQRQYIETGGRIIAIVGARNSGKTNYITVLITEMFKHMNKLGTPIQPIDYLDSDKLSTTERYKSKFYHQLYEEGTCFEGTDVNDELTRVPLVYKLVQDRKPPIFLVFYDTAGENFANILGHMSSSDGTSENADVKFLKAADGIIYLLDSFTIPSVHRDLQPIYKLPPISAANPKFDDIFAKLIQYFDQLPSRDTKRFQRTPIAFAFSKFDAILNHPTLSRALPNLSSDINSHYLDGKGLDHRDFDSVSDAIKAALNEYWQENNFLELISRFFTNYHFFGFSALGSAPSAGNKLTNQPKPYRVLDPLLWILLQLGYKFKSRL